MLDFAGVPNGAGRAGVVDFGVPVASWYAAVQTLRRRRVTARRDPDGSLG